MRTSTHGCEAPRGLPQVSEVAVGRMAAAVRGAMVCFVLVVGAVHALGKHPGIAGDLVLGGLLLLGAAGYLGWLGHRERCE